MLRAILLAVVAIGVTFTNPVYAAACKNAAGHAVRCPAKSAQNGPVRQNGKLSPGRVRTHVTDTSGRVNYKW